MGTGPFRTYANHTWHVRPGWVISGDGMDVTTIQMVGNVAGMRDDVDVFTSDPNVATDNATIKDLTVDCNWAELALTADEGLGSRSVTDAVIIVNSPIISSSTAAFTNEDYAKTLTGTGIPAGTKILSIQDAQHAIMSANATMTRTGVPVTIGGEKNIKTGAIILVGKQQSGRSRALYQQLRFAGKQHGKCSLLRCRLRVQRMAPIMLSNIAEWNTRRGITAPPSHYLAGLPHFSLPIPELSNARRLEMPAAFPGAILQSDFLPEG